MKYFHLIIAGVVLFTPVLAVNAQTETASPSAKISTTPAPTTAEQKELKQLQEKVASQVSKTLKNTKAIAGVVQKVEDKSLTINTLDKDTYEVKLDDALTNYYQVNGATTKEVEKKNVVKGDYIIVTGPQFDKSVNANVVYIDERFVVNSGKIIEVNKEDYFIKVMTDDKDTYTLDIQNSTNQLLMDIKTLAVEKVGFSKLKEGDTIHFVVKRTDLLNPETRFDAIRILVIPQEYFLK